MSRKGSCVEGFVPNAAGFRSRTCKKSVNRESSDLICRLIHQWIEDYHLNALSNLRVIKVKSYGEKNESQDKNQTIGL